jgi:hypothetical protein
MPIALRKETEKPILKYFIEQHPNDTHAQFKMTTDYTLQFILGSKLGVQNSIVYSTLRGSLYDIVFKERLPGLIVFNESVARSVSLL